MSIPKDAKAMARSLRVALADRNFSLSHSECLEIVARQFGLADWNTLAAQARTLSCSFCGKSRHDVRSLFEGGCSRPRHAPESCVFICDECVTLCAEVSADTVCNGVPPPQDRA